MSYYVPKQSNIFTKFKLIVYSFRQHINEKVKMEEYEKSFNVSTEKTRENILKMQKGYIFEKRKRPMENLKEKYTA